MPHDKNTIDTDLVRSVLYGTSSGQRFTQDSPVLPEIWLEFARDPGTQVRSLIVPHSGNQAHVVANELYRQIRSYRDQISDADREPSNVSDIPSVVAADLYLDEIVNVVLPMTGWWRDYDFSNLILEKSGRILSSQLMNTFSSLQNFEVQGNVGAFRNSGLFVTLHQSSKRARDSSVLLLLLLGMFECARKGKFQPNAPDQDNQSATITGLNQFKPGDVGRAVKRLFLKKFLRRQRDATEANRKLVFTVSLHRTTDGSVADSVPTTKADAAKRLFDISCDQISWAIIDSGIDANHYAFKRIHQSRLYESLDDEDWENSATDSDEVRIEKKYDLTFARSLRNRDIMLAEDKRTELAEFLYEKCNNLQLDEIVDRLERLKSDIASDRPIDWDVVEELVVVDLRKSPESDHGTHVAGTLGGRWPDTSDSGQRHWVEGMCPDITLYDFQVIGSDLKETEFAVIAALRLIRHMNERNDFFVIHGANLSLSIKHDVTNYACGRTPVCDECEKLVGSGVVVVAAAGNEGYNDFLTKKGNRPLHTSTSITDPGNSESVITVGSTHRREPHTYGISYFSSRGPTGDGRAKPDIIAPGEKIDAPVPGGEFATLEGTSMAAPHVSGAAAMLMARFPELIGQPRRIKKILCSTATDLGRERFHQGNGLLDILRALQSV